MSTLRSFVAVLAAPLLLLAALHARPAAAETLTCTAITSLPTTISSPGHYCINYNFAASYATAAVNINASNVVLDCNDNVITQIGAAAVSGVYVSNKTQVEVRNCVIVGFGRGISFFESANGASRNNIVRNNQVRRSKIAGIQMAGSTNLIENNHVSENLGLSGSDYTYGIMVSSFGGLGVGNVIRRNVISDIAPAVYARVVGIYLLDIDQNEISDNHISALFPPLDLGVYGIVGSATSGDNIAIGNNIMAVQSLQTPPTGTISYGGASYDGIRFDATPTQYSHNNCVRNQVGHFNTDILGESTTGCAKYENWEF
jgi:parallel beta-helix repeat protein